MKKFDRLPLQQRKEEIQTAALALFNQKGFAATTMENIVEQVSLSKGGVYRIYPSTAAILSDLMIDGMRRRNEFYELRARQETDRGNRLTMPVLIDMVADSLLLYPEISAVYVEFLWEKRRNPALEDLYRQLCDTAVRETGSLIRRYGAEELLQSGSDLLRKLTELMNAAVLSLHILDLGTAFPNRKDLLCRTIADLLNL